MHVQYHGSRGKRASAPMAEINIIPLVDVVLVLLIIFMATTAFVKESGLKMELPTAKSTETRQDDQTDLSIALTSDGKVYLNAKASNLGEVERAMRQAAARSHATPVILKGDKDIAYWRIIEVMDMAKQAGLPKVALGTRLPEASD